jgi:hypothetical protein
MDGQIKQILNVVIVVEAKGVGNGEKQEGIISGHST